MYNSVNNNLPINFVNYFVKNQSIHRYGTRSSFMYRPHTFHTDLARHTIRTQGPILWNEIDEQIKVSPNVHTFKRRYKKYLLSLYV